MGWELALDSEPVHVLILIVLLVVLSSWLGDFTSETWLLCLLLGRKTIYFSRLL